MRRELKAMPAIDTRATLQNGLVTTLVRYGTTMAGPIAVSTTHFLASIVLLRSLPPAEFGLFAFILVILQFCFGLSNALIGTPFTVTSNQWDFQPVQSGVYFEVNLLLAAGAGLVCGVAALMVLPGSEALFFALFGALATLRWFLRAYLFALHKPMRVAVSDFVYAGMLIAGLAAGLWVGLSIGTAIAAFVAAAALSILFLGAHSLGEQLNACFPRRLREYGTVWLNQSRWTLLGVTASEATANGYAYLVVAFAGPLAFAPLAAAALFFKPVLLCITSLTQLERPAMARAIAAGEVASAISIVTQFRFATVAVWLLTLAIAFLAMMRFPDLFLKDNYDLDTIVIAAMLWGSITLLQAWQAPSSALLQAAGRFAPLAKAGIPAGLTAIVIAILLLLVLEPVFSLLGVLTGQAVMGWRIARLLKSWKQS